MTETAVHLAPIASSAEAELFGWSVATAERRSLVVNFAPTQPCCDADGVMAPIFGSAMIELAFRGLVLLATGGRMQASPVDIHVQFVDEAALTGTAVATVGIVRQGATVAFMDGDLRNGEGVLILRATCRSRLATAEQAALENT